MVNTLSFIFITFIRCDIECKEERGDTDFMISNTVYTYVSSYDVNSLPF